MKKNILVQVGTRTEQREVISYNDDNESIVTIESYEVPIMEARNVDMTEEEIAVMESMPIPPIEPTTEERIDAIESALLDIIMGGGIND